MTFTPLEPSSEGQLEQFAHVDAVLFALVRLGYRRRLNDQEDARATWTVDDMALWIYPDLGEHSGSVYVRVLHLGGRLKGVWCFLESYAGSGESVLDGTTVLAEIDLHGQAWIDSWNGDEGGP
jgi:hypothetical protein